jgi:hypothetical protein
MWKWIKAIAITIWYILIEIPIRIYAMIVYPIAYHYRFEIRKGTTHYPNKYQRFTMQHKWHWLWITLDDSVYMVYYKDYKPNMYSPYRENIIEFFKAYHWSVLRNCCVNLKNWIVIGPVIEPELEEEYCKIRRHALGDRLRIKKLIWNGTHKFDIGWTDGNGRFEFKIRKIKP